jgi:hypothetical protein
MDMHPPPAYVQLQLTPPKGGTEMPAEPTPIKVDVRKYIPESATSATLIVTVTPPTGTAVVYVPGHENYGTTFRGPRSVDDIRLDGPFIYVKLYGAISFDIQYINYRVP